MRTTLCLLVVLLVAALLHLPAHVGPAAGGFAGRDPLPEDRPALIENSALEARHLYGAVQAAKAQFTDPASAWQGTTDEVGRSRWRPVAGLVALAERAVAGESAHRLAGWLGLLLHVWIALAAALLARDLGGGRAAVWCAGLIAAASPAALSSAAWPAHQATALAAALGIAGLRLTLAPGGGRVVVGSLLLALAALCHESALALAPAAAYLRRTTLSSAEAGSAGAGAGEATLGAAMRDLRVLGLPLVAGVAWLAVFWSRGAELAGGGLGAVLDGAAGYASALGAFALPVRAHFADGPWQAGLVGQLIGLGVVLAAIQWVRRPRQRGAAATFGASLIALAPVLFAGLRGGAPYQDGYLYPALALLAAATGLAVAGAVRSGGGLRIAGALAGALLLGANVSATITRSHAFRTTEGLVALGQRDAPSSPVVAAWEIGRRLQLAQSDPAQLEQTLTSLAPRIRELEAQFRDEDAIRRLRRDAVTVAGIAPVLSGYGVRSTQVKLPQGHRVHPAARAAVRLATRLDPNATQSWSAAAFVLGRHAHLREALQAGLRALEIAPDDPGASQITAELAMKLGDAQRAVAMLDGIAPDMLRTGKAPVDFVHLWAEALMLDGATPERTPDGVRFRFDRAAGLLEELIAQERATPRTRRLLYNTLLVYGDVLASSRRPAMARLAYQRAEPHALGNLEAARHLQWLEARLRLELKEAEAEMLLAQSGGGGNVADALTRLAIAYWRRSGPEDRANGDGVFTRLSQALGGVPPVLRQARAQHLYAASVAPQDQRKAVEELEQVLREAPQLARAHFDLARVLDQLGRFEEAFDHYQQAAAQGVQEEWSLDALAAAAQLAPLLGHDFDPSSAESAAAATGLTEADVLKLRGYLSWRRAVWTLDSRDGYLRAIGQFERCRELQGADADFTVGYLLAYCYVHTNQLEKAAPLIDETASLAPTFVGLDLLDAMKHSLAGERQDQIKVLRRYVERLAEQPDPNFGAELEFVGWAHLGFALFEIQDHDDAIDALAKARFLAERHRGHLLLDPAGVDPVPPRLMLRLARAHQGVDAYERAAELIDEVLHDDPGNPSHYYNHGLIAGEQHQLEKARRYHEQALLRQPAFVDPRPKLAYVAGKQEDFLAMRAHLEAYRARTVDAWNEQAGAPDPGAAADVHTGMASYWFEVARLREDLSDEEGAAEAYQRAWDSCQDALLESQGCIGALTLLLQVGVMLPKLQHRVEFYKEQLKKIRENKGGAPPPTRRTFC